jgi:hypothetical protein
VPDLQGRGIGSRLLLAAEDGTRLGRATLFTGSSPRRREADDRSTGPRTIRRVSGIGEVTRPGGMMSA